MQSIALFKNLKMILMKIY